MPRPKNVNTAPATAARLAKARERKLTAMAEELRAAGWLLVPAEHSERARTLLNDYYPGVEWKPET